MVVGYLEAFGLYNRWGRLKAFGLRAFCRCQHSCLEKCGTYRGFSLSDQSYIFIYLGCQLGRVKSSRFVRHVQVLQLFIAPASSESTTSYSICRQNFVKGDSVNPASVDVFGVVSKDIPNSACACCMVLAARTFWYTPDFVSDGSDI